ncbi:hypothetical protein LCGC14_0991200 [marine sediment metagenome]|uniref:DOD-type homing endonuclease domain-containing protein n=1 Tax=marine sediment metagenome TaxID=412755 RepID=A0A0F9RCE3_9ZZZZ
MSSFFTKSATVSAGDSASLDAFGRWRVSNPTSLFDSQLQYNDAPVLWQTILFGGGTTTHLPDESCLELTCGTTSGDRVIRQTFEYFRYQPGKALRHGEPVLTPEGWVNIEEIKVGDTVFDGLGNQTRVIGVYPQGIRQIYRITFDDDSYVDCDGEHLWKTIVRRNNTKGQPRVLSTLEMLKAHGEEPKGFARPCIPAAPILNFDECPVPIDPYTLGAILGDGHIYKNDFVSFTSADEEIVGFLKATVTKYSSKYGYGILGMAPHIRDLGLSGKISYNKLVPNLYKYNSAKVRLQVLQGLMDTDGTVDKRCGTASFTSVSPQLADDVCYLIRSLGGQAKVKSRRTRYTNAEGDRVPGAISYRVTVIMPECPFRLGRKALYWSPRKHISFDRYIHSIKPLMEDKATCIRVASDDHTFITRNHIVTHNSQMITMTGAMHETDPNVRKRVGYFDGYNGVFFEQQGSINRVVLRSSSSGTIVDTVVPQSEWSIDKLNGSGKSRITLDSSKSQMWLIDLQWLGIGRVRAGYVMNGVAIYVHEFNHSNINSSTYMTTANLPLRYEITNLDDTLASTSLIQTCSSIISEGGLENDKGLPFSANMGVTDVAVTTRAAVLTIRPKDVFNSIKNRGSILPSSFSIFVSSSSILYEIVKGGSLGGSPTWTSVADESITEFSTSNEAVTGGEVIDSGYIASAPGPLNVSLFSDALVKHMSLHSDFAGTFQEQFSIVCTSTSGTANVLTSISFRERY